MSILFGKLTWDSLAFLHDPIILGATIFMVLGGIAVVGGLTYFKVWGVLWRDWLTTVDHKKIGIMYILVSLLMLVRGFSDAIMMRTHQMIATAPDAGYLPPHHYDQIFTAHGVIMIFFVAMPLIVGLMNVVLPLQIGARDVAYPFLNSLSFWLYVVGVVLMNASLVIGEFAATGWLAYPPLSGIAYSPGVGVDYYIWALQISGLGTLLSGVNFIVTIIKMRAPGMTYMRMPIFVWTSFCASLLIVAAFPILTGTLFMLTLDRYLDMHFFTNEAGGNMMMYINLIWMWGHPEVYILVLPAFGIFSEVIATFSRKRLFGYSSMVYATMVIGIFSFVVWLHHFFTMGSGANVNAFFGIMTMIIAIPTGVKVFNWLFTMYKGKVEFSVPVLWTLGFLITFTFGGMTGVMLSVPAANFVLHNSLFLIAHFHNTIIGGAVFGYFAGMTYWWPKMFGFKLDEKWGKRSFYFWISGFFVAFTPLYILGFLGMTRRMNYYENPVWQFWLTVAAFGAFLILLGIACQFMMFYVSFKNRKALRDHTGDPWDGRTLEWATASPPPVYNFAQVPVIRDIDALTDLKENGWKPTEKPAHYSPIHMPNNTSVGFIVGILSIGLGFGFVWHIWWMVIGSFLATIATLIGYAFYRNHDHVIPREKVEEIEATYHKGMQEAEVKE